MSSAGAPPLPVVSEATLQLLASLPYALLARAEISHALGGGSSALSLYALDDATFTELCAVAQRITGDREIESRDRRMRRYFQLMPRRWVKLSADDPTALSEYYQLRDGGPSALRLFLHAHGASDRVSAVERAFAPLFELAGIEWGLVVKRVPGSARPRISARMPTSHLARVLQALVRADLLDERRAHRLRDGVQRLGPGQAVYLSVDPQTPGAVAIDVPSPDARRLAAVSGHDLAWLEDSQLSYVKLRFASGDAAPRWTVYRPAVDALPREDEHLYVTRVRRYYDEFTDVIERTFGGTYQAALYRPTSTAYDATASTLALIERSPITRDEPLHLLDLGCGLAGPAIDIALAYPNVRITGVTISPVQVERARERVANAGLETRIDIVEGDYHVLPFADDSFDGAYAFEALAYAHDLARVSAEVRRVVRPGGWLYAKEFVREAGDLSAEALEHLAAHDRTYAMRTPRLDALRGALELAGWHVEGSASLEDDVSTEPYQLAMFDLPAEGTPQLFAPLTPRLTPFGQTHFNDTGELPLESIELVAVQPATRPTVAQVQASTDVRSDA